MILITGATGTVGSEVTRTLVERKAPLRALVRNPARAETIQRLGVEIALGSMAEEESLDRALEGVKRVFLSSSSDPEQEQLQGKVIDAAVRAGVEHIVKLSMWGADLEASILLQRWHARVEQELEGSGLAYTFLRPGYFMQSLLGFIPAIRSEGVIYAPLRDGKINMIDARDVAAVAAVALTEKGHSGKVYELTGPEALSFHDVARVLSKELGKTIHYVDIPPDTAQRAMLEAGVPDWLVDDALKLFASYVNGQAETILPTVTEVTRNDPRTFAQFVRDHLAMFKS